jgi:hypothetical protein
MKDTIEKHWADFAVHTDIALLPDDQRNWVQNVFLCGALAALGALEDGGTVEQLHHELASHALDHGFYRARRMNDGRHR